MSSCNTCGNRDYLCQQCKMDELESRHGLPSENEGEIQHWIQDIDETWHASMYFEDTRHVGACGAIVETPVADLTEDPDRFRDEADTCDDCVAALEDDSEATIPDGGEFERATELRADGGTEISGIDHVLECVHDRTSPEPDGKQDSSSNIWTGRRRMKSDGSSSRSPLERDEVDDVVNRLVESQKVFEWHGLLAPATEEHLQAIMRSEGESDAPRKLLIGKANQCLQAIRSDGNREVRADGGEELDRFTDLPVPDRFFQQISSADTDDRAQLTATGALAFIAVCLLSLAVAGFLTYGVMP